MNATGGPAFPSFDGSNSFPGMSRRDVFAAFAMHAILQHPSQVMMDDRDSNKLPVIDAGVLAQDAYAYADAMLAESLIDRTK